MIKTITMRASVLFLALSGVLLFFPNLKLLFWISILGALACCVVWNLYGKNLSSYLFAGASAMLMMLSVHKIIELLQAL